MIEDYAILGGVTTVHQFCRIGTRAITGASSRVVQDVPPYMMADGHPAGLVGLNSVGLERAGIAAETRQALKRAFRQVFLRGPYAEALTALEADSAPRAPELDRLLLFLRSSQRGIMRARKSRK